MGEDAKQPVSEVPLEVQRPAPRRVPPVALLIALSGLIAGVTAGVWFLILPDRNPRPEHQTQWPGYLPDDPYHNPSVDHDAALEHMKKVADAMLAFRDGPGGGVRWPNSLDELRYSGVIEQDFSFTGPISGEPLVYHPDMPLGHDPARWVMVHDIEIGWVRSKARYYRTKGIRSAVAILGDGTVKLIEGDEIEFYAGLSLGPEAAR